MVEPVDTELISMADIARLAGQSRAVVGNWKARNPDEFPVERGRGSRGPLYDRVEVTAWLEATNRLEPPTRGEAVIRDLLNPFRGAMSTEDAVLVLMTLVAVKATRASDWSQLTGLRQSELVESVRYLAAETFPFTRDVFTEDVPTQAVEAAVAELSKVVSAEIPVLADAFFDQSSLLVGGAEHHPPRSLRRLLTALVEPRGTLYNPATGVGQLMVDWATSGGLKPERIVGQELSRKSWVLAQLNLAIHGVAAEVAVGDVFVDDAFPELRADRIVCVPPWGQRLPWVDELATDPRWQWGELGANDGDEAWIQHCLSHLADGGRAVIVLPQGVLASGGRSSKIRQRIVKAGLLDAVIALPAGLFRSTTVPCSILVFGKGRPTVSGKPAPTLMVDLSESGEGRPGRGVTLSPDLIYEVASTYRLWIDGVRPTADFASDASYDEMVDNDFNIFPARYRVILFAKPDPHELIRAHAQLAARLADLTDASQRADSRLRILLEEA